MEPADRVRFLAEPRVAVLAVGRRSGPPLAVPVWFEYRFGVGFLFVIAGGSTKAKHLAEQGWATVCIQDDRTTYRYVAAEGPVTTRPIGLSELRALWRPTVERYLGVEAAAAFLSRFDEPDPWIVTLHPELWRTAVLDDVSIKPDQAW